MITIILISVFALAIACLVFKVTAKLFAFGLRLVLFGVTAGAFFIVPMMLASAIF